jgi:hypothetical protein
LEVAYFPFSRPFALLAVEFLKSKIAAFYPQSKALPVFLGGNYQSRRSEIPREIF